MNRQPSVKEARVVVAGRLVAGLLDSFICGTMTNDNHSMIVSETAESYQAIHFILSMRFFISLCSLQGKLELLSDVPRLIQHSFKYHSKSFGKVSKHAEVFCIVRS